MNIKQFECMFDSVLNEVVQESYSNFTIPSDEQMQIALKKMMDLIDTQHGWRPGNER